MVDIVKHWDRLPIGTVLVSASGRLRVRTMCQYFRPSGDAELKEFGETPFYQVEALTPPSPRRATVEQGLHNWRIAPESFADSNRRDDLAKAGFFSIDDPDHRERRRVEAEELKRRVDAYASLGLNREALHDTIAYRLEGKLTGGVWAKSSADYYKRIYALDNAILYATGVIDHA